MIFEFGPIFFIYPIYPLYPINLYSEMKTLRVRHITPPAPPQRGHRCQRKWNLRNLTSLEARDSPRVEVRVVPTGLCLSEWEEKEEGQWVKCLDLVVKLDHTKVYGSA